MKLLSGYIEEFIDSICCAKEPHPDLTYGVGLTSRIPAFHKWGCLNGTCNQCGLDEKHKMNECDIQHEQLIDLLECNDIPRQGFKKDGKPNTQLELS